MTRRIESAGLREALAWTNVLPDDWESRPLRAVADYVVSNVDKLVAEDEYPVRLCNYTDVYNSEFLDLHGEYMRATATEAEIKKFGLVVGDVIITKDSEAWDDIAVPALVRQTSPDFLCGYHLAVLRPHEGKMHGAFLLRCLQSKPIRLQFALAARGVTRFGLPKSEIGNAVLPVPPLPKQRAIADFLDQETARLDSLVAEKERLLGLLDEKRQAVITRAVTRGLNADRPCRDSGSAWLGDIPAQWESRKIAWLFRERDQRGYPELPLLEVSLNSGVVERELTGEKIESTASDFNSYKVARKGDLVFNKMRMWQGAVGVAPLDGLVSPDYVVAEPSGELSSGYAGLLFRTPAFSAECARRSHGIVWDRLRLYWDGFREIEVPLPAPSEQATIVDHVRKGTRKIDELISVTGNAIALLEERRSAVIAASIAGQIDMEGVA